MRTTPGPYSDTGIVEGWGWPPGVGARRWHYFRTNNEGHLRSLCGKYRWPTQGSELKHHETDDELDCVICARKREAKP